MKHLIAWLAKWKALMLAFVKPFGVWGIGVLATVDAAGLPLPMDLIMAGYAWADRQHFYLYAIVAGAGSAVGALLPYWIGRAGGEFFLQRKVNRAKFDQVKVQFEKREFVAMTISSVMPPPMPWKLFVFGAGVFDMSVWKFILAVFVGRTARYLIEGLLTVLYGPQIIRLFHHLLKVHLILVLVSMLVVMGAGIWWAVWRLRRKKSQTED